MEWKDSCDQIKVYFILILKIYIKIMLFWILKSIFILIFYLVLSLQELCCRAIVARTTQYGINQLPLPVTIKSHLKSYALTSFSTLSMSLPRNASASKKIKLPSNNTGVSRQHGHPAHSLSHHHHLKNTPLSISTSYITRNSCTISWLKS
jgi:Ras-related protein Rab-40